MLHKIVNNRYFQIILLIFLIGTISILFTSLGNSTKLILILMLFTFIASLFDYRKGFFILLFLRPVIDLATTQNWFYISGFNINLIFGALLIIFSLIVLAINYENLKINKLIAIWGLFLLWSFASLYYSFNIYESLRELARYTSIILNLVLGFLLIKNNKDLRDLIKIIIWSGLIPSLVALYQYLSYSGFIQGNVNRVYGTMTHPNMLAFFIILPITLAIFIFLNIRKERVESYIYLFLTIFYSSILIITYTRGAYVVLIIILLLLGILKFRKFLAIAGLALLLVYLSVLPIQERVNTIFINNQSDSINWRLKLYSDSLSYIGVHPVIGYGVGLSENVIANNRDFRLGATEPHNDYILLTLENGIIGLGIYLLLILTLIYQLFQKYLKEERPRLKMLSIFLLIFTIALHIMSGGDNSLSDTSLEWQYWALIGALFALPLTTNNQQE